MELSALGVTAAKAKQFEKKGIDSAGALLRYFPRKYLDLSRETGVLPEPELSVVSFRVEGLRSAYGRVHTLKALGSVEPGGEKLTVTWFNQNYLLERLRPLVGQTVLAAGKIKRNGSSLELAAPELFAPESAEALRIYPVYGKIPGMSTEYLTEKIRLALGYPELTEESLPPALAERLSLPPLREAIVSLHRPASAEDLERGKRRLIFDGLLRFAVQQEWAARQGRADSPFSVTPQGLALAEKLRSLLPYTLTEDQAAAVEAMLSRAGEGKRISALVQGDVGCGKTAVAFLLMAAFAGSGYQAALMAPTQVLARQHAESLTELCGPLGYEVAFLGSGMPAAERRQVLAKLAAGELLLAVGTHALLSGDVRFSRLALTVTDEEHRFGVDQRAALVEKASEGVHSLSMSATPIPRSLARVIYGSSVQLHTIRQLPAGRVPVQTGIALSRLKIYRFLLVQIREGRQAYVVCPLIDKGESELGYESVEAVTAQYAAALGPQGVRIASLTGRDGPRRAAEVLDAFRRGELDLLISTTVVEVGVNVPNATVMVITGADRFGLSSLHQLRGRVGRGTHRSFCVLECENASEEARARLEILCGTTDGFRVAEADLQQRGAGDFIGTRQSGENRALSLMLAEPELYAQAQAVAGELLDRWGDCPLVREALREQRTGNA